MWPTLLQQCCFIAVLGLLSVLGVKRGPLTIVPLTPLRRVGQCTGAVQVQTCVTTSHCTCTQGHNDMTSATMPYLYLCILSPFSSEYRWTKIAYHQGRTYSTLLSSCDHYLVKWPSLCWEILPSLRTENLSECWWDLRWKIAFGNLTCT